MVRNKLSKNQSGDVGSPLLYGIHQKNNNRAKFQDIYKYFHCIPEHISLFSWTTASLKRILDLVYVNFSLSDDYACAFWSIYKCFVPQRKFMLPNWNWEWSNQWGNSIRAALLIIKFYMYIYIYIYIYTYI